MRKNVEDTNRRVVRQIALGGVLMVFIIVSFLVFTIENHNRILKQNENYAADVALQKAGYVDEVLSDAQNSIKQIAFLYSQGDTLTSGEVAPDVLQEITANTPFDYIEFIDSNGIDHTALGETADVSDRNYFIEGMKGNSGIDVIFDSKITNETLVVFYAPIYRNGEVAGVLNGNYREKRMQEILDTAFFGEKGKAYLCMADGTVISDSVQERHQENMLELLTEYAGFREDTAAEFRKAFLNRESYGCVYRVPEGSGNIYITGITSADWMIIQAFPANVTDEMIHNANAAGIRLEILLILAFVLYIIGLVVWNQKRNRSLVNEKQKMDNIVGGVTELFSRLVVVNLNEDTYAYLDDTEHDIPKEGRYTELISHAVRKYINSEGEINMAEVLDSRFIQEHLTEDKPYLQYDYRIQTEEDLRWENISIICLERDKGRAVTVLFAIQDMTSLKEEEIRNRKALQEATEMAEAANNAKTTFLFNMSHDIRTPMNAIIGFTDLLEKYQERPEKRADYLKKIQDSNRVLLSIINNVLEMARIEKGTLEVEEAAWSAEQFNDTLHSVFQDMMLQKGIEFTRQIDVEHHYVFCDPIKLREVFINILSNAWKYTNAGGKVNMHLEEIPSDREGYALYRTTISDTGIGMSEEFLPHIFEEFSRENSVTDSKVEGTGLGMPIVKRLVDFMDGTVEVSSKKGAGTTFVVTIPHKIADKSDLVEHMGIKLDPKQFLGKRILLAEDNDLNAEIAIEILKEAGFETERAEDGQIAVDMIRNAEAGYYDLVLMDIQMPNMNGHEATRNIRKLSDVQKAGIPILAMTANAFEEDKRAAVSAGMNGHLGKPINVNELMKALAGILK